MDWSDHPEMRRAWLVITILGAEACVDHRTVDLLVPPYLFVAPLEINFGAVPVGERRLEILELALDDDDGVFALVDVPRTVAPGQRERLQVEFLPEAAGDKSAVLTVVPDAKAAYFYLDADASIPIPVRGIATTPGPKSTLRLYPNPLDFGSVPLACGLESRTLTVANVGVEPVALGAPRWANGSAFAADLSSWPHTLPPGREVVVPISFLPPELGSFDATLFVSSEVGGESFSDQCAILGEARPEVEFVDEVGPSTNSVRDILFVVDDSCSMEQEQQRLAQNFSAFIAAAAATSIDYRIGVTTTDVGDGNPAEAGRLVPLDGPLANRVVTPWSLPSPSERFRDNALVGIDRSTQVEQGLEAVRLALSPALSAGHNAGFLRDEADLAIVIVSDEDDQGSRSVEELVAIFRALKPGRPNAIRLSVIGGPPPVGCLGPNGSAIGGIRYEQAANQTGGIFESICTTDWAASLAAVSEATFGLPSKIFLRAMPAIGTIEVQLDGRVLPAQDWSYDRTLNAVEIGALTGEHAQVSYQPLCE